MKIFKGLISKATLEVCFKEATETGAHYVALKIKTVSCPGAEIIINGVENFNHKLDYLRNAYNDDLTLKHAPGIIKIEALAYGNTFSELARVIK